MAQINVAPSLKCPPPGPKRKLAVVLFVFALLVGLPSWLIYRVVHHEYLNRELITAIKATNSSRVLNLLQQGADGDARDIPEPQPLSLTQQIVRIFHRKSQQEILQREQAPTVLWLFFNYIPMSPDPYRNVVSVANVNLWTPSDLNHVLEALLQHGARVNQDSDGTPLCWAARSGVLESMQVLLKYGADPNKGDAEGHTALFYAEASVPAVQLLLTHGAKSDVRDTYGKTVLRFLYDRENDDATQFWIQNGADLNAKDKKGDTLLTSPVHPPSEAILKALMAHGADINAHGEGGTTPLMRAANFEDEEATVRLLLKYGAEVNACDENGETALFYGTFNLKSVQLLLEHGADVNVRNKNGKTALALALQLGGQDEMVTLLKKHGAK